MDKLIVSLTAYQEMLNYLLEYDVYKNPHAYMSVNFRVDIKTVPYLTLVRGGVVGADTPG